MASAGLGKKARVFEVYIGRYVGEAKEATYEKVREYHSLVVAQRFGEGWNSNPDKDGEALVIDSETGNIVWQESGVDPIDEECARG